MRKFINCMLFSLLLVGWTVDAAAQALPKNATCADYTSFILEEKGRHAGIQEESPAKNQGQQLRAPRRSQTFSVTSPTVHPKSWYQALPDVTWDGGSQNITEPFTNVDGMMALVERVYTDKTIPGFKYSEPLQCDIPYQTIQQGWDIYGMNYEPFTITTRNYDTYIYGIAVRDSASNIIASWFPGDDGTTLPQGWSCNATIRTYSYSNQDCAYIGTRTSGGTITIDPSSFVNRTVGGVAQLVVWYAAEAATTITVNGDEWDVTTSWQGTYTEVIGCVDAPDDAGYTVMLVKLQDNFEQRAPEYTYSRAELRNYFQTYIKEIQLLTDGMRVDEGTADAGTVFAYTGDLNKFYFIGKGKMYFLNSLNKYAADRAPFYSMYEEFSPYVSGGVESHADFYEKMKQGVTYPIIHDCEGVIYMEHWFAMTGQEGDQANRVNSLVFYIPDNRGVNGQKQTYDPEHQPTVGMYMIDLYADVEPSSTPDFYTVTVDWYDNLDEITHTDNIPQTYKLYEIRYNEQTGQNDTTLVYEGPNTTWTQDYPVGDPTYYDLHYYVIGTPTDATNQDTFFAKSNTDDVTIPGKEDFLGLQWWRYESDYVTDDGINQEVNYYRNWLAPHALAVQGETGITAGNVGTAGRTLTLYRDDNNGNVIPVIDLELMMDGNKAYYRIKYRPNTQKIEPGYNEDGERTSTNN